MADPPFLKMLIKKGKNGKEKRDEKKIKREKGGIETM